MTETFRDLIDLFPRKRRPELLAAWNRKLPQGCRRIDGADLNMWRHRNSIPGWAWASLVAASDLFELSPPLTIERLVAADVNSRAQRKDQRPANAQVSNAA